MKNENYALCVMNYELIFLAAKLYKKYNKTKNIFVFVLVFVKFIVP